MNIKGKKPDRRGSERGGYGRRDAKSEPKKKMTREEPKKEEAHVEESVLEPKDIVTDAPIEDVVETEPAKVKGIEKIARDIRPTDALESWAPKTRLGEMVQKGEISSLEQVYERNLPILEHQIMDKLVPNLEEEILQIKPVQRSTDSGRKMSFFVVAAVGNKNGYIGVGRGRGLSLRPAIENAVKHAKKNVVSIRRGCGSWECGCGKPHTIPYGVKGKYGSVSVQFLPAPKGTGLVVGGTARKVLSLAGIADVWGKTSGSTGTTLNYAIATLHALRSSRKFRLSEAEEKRTEVAV